MHRDEHYIRFTKRDFFPFSSPFLFYYIFFSRLVSLVWFLSSLLTLFFVFVLLSAGGLCPTIYNRKNDQKGRVEWIDTLCSSRC